MHDICNSVGSIVGARVVMKKIYGRNLNHENCNRWINFFGD